jgi:hypothetical protein
MNYLKFQPDNKASSGLLDRMLQAPDWNTWSHNFDEYVKSFAPHESTDPIQSLFEGLNAEVKEELPFTENEEYALASPTSPASSFSNSVGGPNMDPRSFLSAPTYHLPLNAFVKVEHANGAPYYACNYGGCGKRFTRRAGNAKAHWIRHQRIKPYICYICSEEYSTLPNWKRHCREQHKAECGNSPV